jgi:hypothetical protein
LGFEPSEGTWSQVQACRVHDAVLEIDTVAPDLFAPTVMLDNVGRAARVVVFSAPVPFRVPDR